MRFWKVGQGIVEDGKGSGQEPAGATHGGDRLRGASGASGAAPAAVATPSAAIVRVLVNGREEQVTALRAARLLATNQATVPDDATLDEANAILKAHDERQARAVRVLVRDGLLLPHSAGRVETDRFGRRWK